MALIAGLLAMLIRLQLALARADLARAREGLAQPGFSGGVMNPEFYAMLFTMHGTIMVFFVLSTAPVSGFGNILIPLQVGARDMAFPFLNGLSYWTFLPGCVIVILLLLRGAGAAAGGWTSYPPLSALQRRDTRARAVGPDALDHRDGLLHRLLHDGRPQLPHHDPEPAHQGPVADAACRSPCGRCSWWRSWACWPSPP